MQKVLECKMSQIFNIEQFYSLFSHQNVLQVLEVSLSEEWLSMGRVFLVAGFSNKNEIQGFLMNYFVICDIIFQSQEHHYEFLF